MTLCSTSRVLLVAVASLAVLSVRSQRSLEGLVLDDINPKDAAAGNVQPRRPLIYIYDFGEEYHDYRRADKMSLSNPNYALVQVFPKLLLKAPHHITTDPEKADYFFAHVWAGFPTEVATMIKLMRAAGPWWDRKQGADHIIPWAADEGRCMFHHPDQVVLINHFGRISDYMRGMPCDLTKVWGAECDPTMTWPPKPKGCHLPGVDLIVPPTVLEFRPDKPDHHSFTTTPFTHKADAELAAKPKSILLFHGGQVDPREAIPPSRKHEPHYAKMNSPFESLPYSFGARQTVARLYEKQPGFVILHKNTRNYSAYLESATFCLATAGSGWSSRYKVAITHGCIPVIVQDGTAVEWEDVLPIHEFAIRVPLWMIHRLDEILREFIKEGIAAKMQKALSCVWRLHWWRRPYGRAFELTMCELKRRALRAPRVELDLNACTLKCGDDHVVNLREAYNNV